MALGNRGLCPLSIQPPSLLQAVSSLSLERPGCVWVRPSKLPCWPVGQTTKGAVGRMWRASKPRMQTVPQYPAPHGVEKILGTISEVLKEPPGFAHFTENKRPLGRLGFCSEVCFLSASSLVGERGALSWSPRSDVFPTNAPTHDLLPQTLFHAQVNAPAVLLQTQKTKWLKVSSWVGGVISLR